MKIENFVQILNADFFTGVPDSQLKALCDYLIKSYGINSLNHIIAANEGNAVGLAAGYHLATGKVPVVYMQNSGEGNSINPIASLLNEKVYGIPCIFVIGWRGEPGVHDESQHIFQGEITNKILEIMDIVYMIIDKETTEEQIKEKMNEFNKVLAKGKQVGFVVRKDTFEFDENIVYKNQNRMSREEIIKHIVSVSKEDAIVATTGKASRELFEIREKNHQNHCYDFLTVGSMGHASSIALGIALQRPNKKIWIIDGDGAVLMHMGAMAVLGANRPKNIVHIIINNESHETVGGQPTAMKNIDICKIAEGCGYVNFMSVSSFSELDKILFEVKEKNELSLIEIKSSIGSRKDLGRPTTTAKQNKELFMEQLKNYVNMEI